jgi:DNA-binding protein H-NS
MHDLNGMSLDELKALQKDVAKAIDGYQNRKKADALAAVDALAREHGFTLFELVGGTSKAKAAPRPAKYRHPENPAVTWSGRGRQPAWIKEALAAGKSLDAFLIR